MSAERFAQAIAPTLPSQQLLRVAGELLKPGETADTYGLARDLQQPVYAQPATRRGMRRPCCNYTICL